MFDLKEYIKLCCVKKGGIKTTKLAELSGISKQNLWNKYDKNKFTNQDLEKISNALNSDLRIQFIDRDTKEPII